MLAEAANEREKRGDPTAHAEVLALREAARVHGDGWRLTGCDAGGHAGAVHDVRRRQRAGPGGPGGLRRDDPKAGAAGSLWDVVRDRRLNHRPEVVAGVRAEESGALLRAFFRGQRGL